MDKSLILMSGCLNRLPVLPVQYVCSVPSVDELEKKTNAHYSLLSPILETDIVCIFDLGHHESTMCTANTFNRT